MVKILIIDEILKAQAGGGEGGASAPSESRCKGQLLKFLMPGDKQKRLFLLQDSILYELQQPCMGGKTSWFMDNEVVQDGSFYLATPFQAIFLLLPLLEAASTHFTSVEQLLSEDRNFNALRACRNLDLSHVCEVKKAGDDEYFKLSNAKLTNWLKGRVARLQAVLDTKRISGSHQRSSQVNQVAAMNILEEYLSKDRFAALRDSYGIRDYSKEVAKASFQSNKRRVIGDDEDVAGVMEGRGMDEQKGNGGGWNRQGNRATRAKGVPAAKKTKLSAKPPKGMKSMFSFFSKKPKPK